MRPPQSVIRWGEILKRTGRAIYKDDCLGWAGELAFFWFLALFPALLFVVALAGSLPVQHLIDFVVGSLARVAPGDVLVLVQEQLVQIAQGPPRGLLTLSLLGALWSSSSAMTAIIDTLNQAYHVREGRSWWRVRLLAVGLTVVLVAFTLIAVTLVMIGPMLAEYLENGLGVPPRFAWLWAIVEWPLAFGLMVTALGWVYYFAPNVRRRWAWITPGSIAATLLWMLASLRVQVVRQPFRGVPRDVRRHWRRHRGAALALRVGPRDSHRRGAERRHRACGCRAAGSGQHERTGARRSGRNRRVRRSWGHRLSLSATSRAYCSTACAPCATAQHMSSRTA